MHWCTTHACTAVRSMQRSCIQPFSTCLLCLKVPAHHQMWRHGVWLVWPLLQYRQYRQQGAHNSHSIFKVCFGLIASLWTLQSEQLAQHIVQRVPAASIAALCATLAAGSPAAAADFFQQPQQPQSGAPTQTQQSGSPQTMDFQGSKTENAPAVSKMLCCFAVSMTMAAGLLVKITDLTLQKAYDV